MPIKPLFEVPRSKRIRLIVNTDAKNEADDQFAIVHALLTPRFDIRGLIAAHFGSRSPTSMEDSYAEIHKLLGLMGERRDVPVFRGADRALPSERTPVASEGAELIIREAMAEHELPLFVIFLGPLTDLAAAYLQEPRIADRLTAVWIGGGRYPEGGAEFNLGNDIHAANVVFRSPIPALASAQKRLFDGPRQHSRVGRARAAVRRDRRLFVPPIGRVQSGLGRQAGMAERRIVVPRRFAGGQSAARRSSVRLRSCAGAASDIRHAVRTRQRQSQHSRIPIRRLSVHARGHVCQACAACRSCPAIGGRACGGPVRTTAIRRRALAAN